MFNHLYIAHGCFQVRVAALSICDTEHMACKHKIFTVLNLTGSLPTSAIDKESVPEVIMLKTFSKLCQISK